MSAVAIAACNWVALTNVVVRLDPFHRTTAPLTNPEPFTVSVNAAVPAVALAGDSELIVGTGFAAVIVKLTLLEAPPPGDGLTTVTCAVPAVAMSAAVIAACNCVALTNVVVRFAPFQFTTAPLTNPEPFTVSVNAAVPATAFAGERVLIVGTGLFTVMVPPAPATVTELPFPKAPITLLIGMESSVFTLEGFSVAVTTATTPLPIAVAFIPLARHITEPVPALQLSVLPAAVSADPADIVRELMSLGA